MSILLVKWIDAVTHDQATLAEIMDALTGGTLPVMDGTALTGVKPVFGASNYTANTVLVAGDSGKTLTNDGAVAEVDLTLPAAAVNLYFYVNVLAAQVFKLIPAGTDKIYWNQIVPAGGTEFDSNEQWATALVVCTKTGKWFVFTANGTWNIS